MSWLPWHEAWMLALYGPQGFYRRPEGPAGHFATSAHGVGPAATRLVAEALLELARRHRLGRLVDVGAGRGELLAAAASVAGRDAPSLLGVDVVHRPAGLPEEVGWLVSPGGAALPAELAGLSGTLLLAHEWLDVLPCPVAERDGAGVWRVVEVEVDAASGRERPGAPVEGAELDWILCHTPAGTTRVEVGLHRDRAFADLVGRVDSGLVVVVDYGHTSAGRPPTGTLTAYRSGVQVRPVPDGTCDLTAHVAVDTLGAQRLITQREALADLLRPVPVPPPELARADPAAYLAALGRRSALTALTRSDGLGGFWWAMHGRGRVRLG